MPADAHFSPKSLMSRRRFVQGLATGGVMATLSPLASAMSGMFGQVEAQSATGIAPVLTGTEFHLTVAEAMVNFTGSPRMATVVNGMIPAPTLQFREGDDVTIHVKNALSEDTSIHWHGIILPYQMDGVPGISFRGIPPGQTFTYRFKVAQTGTYWYHSHSGMQEQTGMYGAIRIIPRHGEQIRADRDYVVHLSDWTDEDPMRIYAKLKSESGYYNYNKPTVMDFFRDVANDGLKSAYQKRAMWNEMRMSPTDLADLSAETLTFLMNGTTPAGNWTGLFTPGEKIRLRFINGAGNTFYDVRIPGLTLTVVQTDGVDVHPVTVDEFRFGPGETYDVIVAPKDDAYTIFAQTMDRSGYARGTLAVQNGLQAPVPEPDKIQWLSMSDMMGRMSHDDHGTEPVAGNAHAGHETATMDHAMHGQMDHGAMGHGAMGHGGMDHGAMNHGTMNHAMHGGMHSMDHANPLAKPSTTVRHARTEYGVSTDMRVDMPRTNLDDPGVGLRNNGRRVLTLADLKTIGGPLDKRLPRRELEFHLTGNMERYMWSMDGVAFGDSTPVSLKYGERVRIILHNDTMMTHPMHMHGLWSELETADGKFQVRKHTIAVQPAQRISYLVTADALGRWAWHCHLAMHMDGGMFREVVVS